MPPPLSSSISAAAAAARARPRVLLLSVVAPPAAGRLASFSTTTTTTTTGMAGTEETKAAAPPQKQQQQGGGGGVVSERIMPHLLNIYGSCATARDFEIYAPHATFEDPLMRAHGVKQIKSAFYTLPKVFGESKIAEYTIQENATGPGKVEIVIDNKQHYKFLGKGVDVASLITLDVEDGKVVKHEDWWDKKPLKSRETVGLPLVGRVAEASRRGAMLLTHALMAFGKDPSS